MGLADANNAGNVHGGVIMHLCDEVAGIAAVRHSGARVVTAAMDRMNFRHPVFVGQLVTVKATVNAAWRTSMEVGVRVESENVRSGEVLHTSTAYLTMVAIDDEGNPSEVPPIAPRRRTRSGGRARRSCAGTPALRSGSGSRRSGPAPDVRKLAPLGELALADRVADLHGAAAGAAGTLAQREGGEHVVPSSLSRTRSARHGRLALKSAPAPAFAAGTAGPGR